MQPVFHTRVWGGRRLETIMHKTLPDAQPYGESWEMHDTTPVANGPFAGQTIGALVRQYGAEIIGPDSNPDEGMPLLVKILDANDWLSVQVHPDDAQAKRLESDPRGKTEAWIVLSADAGARLVIGLRPGTTREAAAEAIKEGNLESMLVSAEVQTGDVLYIAANTIHALGPGLLIYEIQQSSDITYRMYDWNRLGLDGKPRPLHVDKALDVSSFGSLPTIHHTMVADGELLSGPYFVTWQHKIHGTPVSLPTNGHFHTLTCIEGSVTVEANGHTETLSTGQTALIPAAVDSFTLSGGGRVLRSFQP
jgi:mannose-6-phosphate isomerase